MAKKLYDNHLPTNLLDLRLRQTLKLASSTYLDSAQFGCRVTRFLALAAAPRRTEEEETLLSQLYQVLSYDFANPHMRDHLARVLEVQPVTELN